MSTHILIKNTLVQHKMHMVLCCQNQEQEHWLTSQQSQYLRPQLHLCYGASLTEEDDDDEKEDDNDDEEERISDKTVFWPST